MAGQGYAACPIDKGTRVGIISAVILAVLYFAITWLLLRHKLRWFRQMPWTAVNKGVVYNTLQVDCRL